MWALTSSALRFFRPFIPQRVPYSSSYCILLFSRGRVPCPRRLLRMEPSSSLHSKPLYSASASRRSSGRGRGRDFGRGGSVAGGNDRIDALGRLMTRILRHMAAELNLEMRSDGYVRVVDLLKLNMTTFAKVPLKSHTIEEIKEAVRRDNKQRFSLLEEKGELLIRANQGHSIMDASLVQTARPRKAAGD